MVGLDLISLTVSAAQTCEVQVNPHSDWAQEFSPYSLLEKENVQIIIKIKIKSKERIRLCRLSWRVNEKERNKKNEIIKQQKKENTIKIIIKKKIPKN